MLAGGVSMQEWGGGEVGLMPLADDMGDSSSGFLQDHGGPVPRRAAFVDHVDIPAVVVAGGSAGGQGEGEASSPVERWREG